jgi:hypothetical protein
MYVVRWILVFLIVYLIVRAFIIAGEEAPKKKTVQDNDKSKQHKGVPKGLGEYIDYEEIDKSV